MDMKKWHENFIMNSQSGLKWTHLIWKIFKDWEQ